ITFSYLFYSEQLQFMEFTFNLEYFIRHQVSNLDFSPQEFLESVHELVDLPQEVMNSPYNVVNSYQGLANSFQDLMYSSQEVLCDIMHDKICNEMRNRTYNEVYDEVHDEMCDEMHNGTYDEVHDEMHDEMHEIHKGQDLVGINGLLPHINKAIVFTIDDTFPNWPIAEHYIAEYGCSKKLNCNWKVNLSFATGVVHITHFNDNHVEHQLSPDTKIFAPVNRRFSDDCCEEIRHLAVNGRCDLSTIRSLLSVKYPDQLFLTRDLANVVAQLRREHNVERSEASQLLKQLYEFREKNPNWYIESLVMGQLKKATGIFSRILMADKNLSMKYVVAYDLPDTKHLFCLYHLSQNLSKNLCSKLGRQYANFIKDFYSTRNSLNESVFEAKLTNLLNNYSATSSYLQKLFLSKESWACAHTFKIFTGGMQSTQRVEELNNHIKTAINSSSTLLQVMETIHQHIERESLSQRFNSWSQDQINYNDNLVLQTVFPQVV
ncbi:10888_t:CDS:2, partial [Dentiscutata erythropus]